MDIPASCKVGSKAYAPTAEYLSQLLERGDHRSVHALERDIRAWITAWNEIPKPFVWTNTAEQILESIGTINETNQRRGTLARIAAGGKCFFQTALTTSAVQQGILETWRSTSAAPGRRSTNCSPSMSRAAMSSFSGGDRRADRGVARNGSQSPQARAQCPRVAHQWSYVVGACPKTDITGYPGGRMGVSRGDIGLRMRDR